MMLHVAITEAECELADIAAKVLRRGMVIDAGQATLKEREHALDVVGGDVAPDVFARAVIDGFVLVEQPANAVVDGALVRVDGGADLNVPMREADRVPACDAGADLGLDVTAATFTASDNGCLADATTAKPEALELVPVGFLGELYT